jgi:hypothetical protein
MTADLLVYALELGSWTGNLAVQLASIAAGLTAAAVIGRYLLRLGRFLAMVGRGVGELANLPGAVKQLSDSLRALGETSTARLDAHEHELARLATFHPQEMTQ